MSEEHATKLMHEGLRVGTLPSVALIACKWRLADGVCVYMRAMHDLPIMHICWR